MRKHVVATALSLVLVLAQFLSVPPAQAAPGDFLSKWSARQYVPDAVAVAVDKEDNVYVTTTESVHVFDSSGVLIRKWGSYGSGDGQFSFPDGIAVDPKGNVYIADTGNNRIQVFDASGAFLWKWAVSNPFSIATDGESVYVVGIGSIRLYDNHGTLLTEFGRCDGCWNGLDDLTLTDEGLLYVFYYGDRPIIRVYNGTELVKTVELDAISGAITADRQGRIYVLGQGSSSGPPIDFLRIYDRDLRQVASLFERRAYRSMEHIAVDSSGHIFMSGDPLYALDSAANPRWIHWPQSLASDKSGNVYVVGGHFSDDSINNKIEVFSGRGELLRQWTGTFCETAGIAVDGSSHVHVIDYGYHPCFSPRPEDCRCGARSLAEEFDASGNFIRNWGMSIFPSALAIDINGRFLVAVGPGIDVYDRDGNLMTSFPCPGAGGDEFYAQVRGIAVDRNGNIFVVDSRTSSVHVFDSSYRLLRTWGGRGTDDGRFNEATGIAVDGMGHIFVADSANDRIQVFDEYGNFLLKWGGSGSLDGQFSAPYGVLVDKSGAKVYVADQDNHRIQVFEGFAFPSTPCTMSGTVRQGSETGPALAGATVSIAGRTVTTDSTGAFSFTELAPGTYTLTISMAGYVTRTITEYVLDGDRTGQLFYLMEQTYTVSGAVREGSASGAPLAGVTVSMGGKTATTDKLGTFILTGIAGGTYTVTISKPGYVSRNSAGHVVDSNSSDLLFYLTPVYSLTGTVRQGNSTGPLLSGATISIAGQTATTSSTGTFSIAGILGGTYTLSISKAGYATKTVTGYVVNRDQSGLALYLTPLYIMSGSVRQGSATGPALYGATVAIAGKTATTTSTGAFSITGIPAGTYTLNVFKAGYATKTVPGCVINRNISGAIFYLSAGYAMSGTVRQGSATGPVLAGATVAIAGKKATTTSTGTFSLTGIPAGTYTLTISRTGYVTKTVSGYVVNGNKSGLVFYLTAAYSMSGTVRQGGATGPVLAGATVAIAGKTAITSSTGTFSITSIPAGTYTLTISKSGYVTKSVTGVPVNGNKTGLVFYLSPAYTISGTVRMGSATGPVLPGAKVAIAGKSAIAGSTGAFTITEIPAGTYTVTISRTGYVTRTVTGFVVNSNRSGLVFYIARSSAAANRDAGFARCAGGQVQSRQWRS